MSSGTLRPGPKGPGGRLAGLSASYLHASSTSVRKAWVLTALTLVIAANVIPATHNRRNYLGQDHTQPDDLLLPRR